MTGPYALPAAVLAGVLFVAAIVLRLDARGHRLERRITAIGPGIPTEAAAPRSIRVAGGGRRPLQVTLRHLLQVPVDIPGAHVVPIPIVAAIGLLSGVVTSWVAQVFVSPSPALVLGVGTGVLVVRGVFRWERRRYGDLLRRQMPDMIELLSSSVRAGLPVAEAFRAAARELPSPTRDEFSRVIREIALGTAPEAALMGLHERSGVTEYAIFSVTLGVQSRSGGRLSETIQLLAETIRQRIALAGRASALAAEAKLSATVLSFLPFLGGLLMSFTQKDYLQPLLHDPRGRRMVLVGFGLLVVGQMMMRRFIASATRD